MASGRNFLNVRSLVEVEQGKEIEVVPILNPGMVEEIVHIWDQV